ncbi:hypothetical protein [Aquisalinus flavus]|uniref:Uncharacterized protein n=1 Tax=Aquisalinus flavus TaxID=1526572 RepID=A0A8J2Y8A9_9PROT|nr:hypothetical protein [Aquisalinus flavus]MBD0425204.1 hypothetical protein [Aquisalinus flavus]UNE49134.1 hypothetical protein FF099_14275 [Aquisalinus flavus]GGD17914.1 hypothetical protein GCM10011342_28420 [Aquisalinus flavus]
MVLALQTFQPDYEPIVPQLLDPYQQHLVMLDLLRLSPFFALLAFAAILLCDYGFHWFRYGKLPDGLEDLRSIKVAFSPRYRVAVLVVIGLWSLIFFGSLM